MADEQFIDPDSDFSSDKNNYETIVVNQIKETAKVLSEDLTLITKTDSKGITYLEDKRKVAINHIIVLQDLITPFLTPGEDWDEKIDGVVKEINDYVKYFGETEMFIKGKGKVKIKYLVHDVKSVPYNILTEFKLKKYRDMFSLLVYIYKNKKDEIASFSYE